MKIKNDKLDTNGVSYGKLVRGGKKVFSGDVIEVSKDIGDRFIKGKGYKEVKANGKIDRG